MANWSVSETAINNDHGLLAKPLHYQRLERAVQLDSFLEYVQGIFNNSLSSDDDLESEPDNGELHDEEQESKLVNGFPSTPERRSDRVRFYNFSKVKKSRKWLKNILVSDSSETEDGNDSITEEDFQNMLKIHKLKKASQAEFARNPELRQYQYYSAGLLSSYDKFYEHQKLVLGGKKKSKEKKTDKKKAKMKKIKAEKGSKEASQDNMEQSYIKQEEKLFAMCMEDSLAEAVALPKHSKKKAASHEAVMTMKRQRLWVALVKKEIGRAQKQKAATHKEVLTSAKRLAHACQREVRKSALLSQKVIKDAPGRARRVTKEMLLYWKRYEKVEKEHRKRAEKEAQEQLRMDIELREAKRQQRKLNFLITQTELYAHFMSHKISGDQDIEKDQILEQLDEKTKEGEKYCRSLISSEEDHYDSEVVKSQALQNAEDAYKTHLAKTVAFDHDVSQSLKNKNLTNNIQHDFNENFRLTDPSLSTDEDLSQPKMFVGKLKIYQLKGMNWLYNLYDKGINGILADEMGLGKTIQTIAFLATLVEAQGIWGPFLIIAPASTLHNWQQEFTRFVPKFKVLPYWGNTSDRKILRKFWSQKDLHTEHASFHVLITSYQLVVQDVKYFQRIKWQYMVLDEAQAIKSTSSVRWKILLGFNSRNRLLLTGTPIQNSMAELWALLHFIMPTLFDSHDEFNEWFSKDIESHAENKSTIDEKHLSRLHMILKPFMLRRIKKDVENELSDKIEILVYCQLTQRQRSLYQGLKNKISIDDLMQSSSATSSQAQSATSSLMNLVMQFRKVCNHPDLFERREVKSPFLMVMDAFILPSLLYNESLDSLVNSIKKKLLTSTFSVFHPEHVHHALFSPSGQTKQKNDCFSFLRFINLSPEELFKIVFSGLLSKWLAFYLTLKAAYRIHHKCVWHSSQDLKYIGAEGFLLSPLQFISLNSLQLSHGALYPLIFTSYCDSVYSLEKHAYYYMKETSQHHEMRARKAMLKQHNISSVPANSSSHNTFTSHFPHPTITSSPKKLQSPPHHSVSRPLISNSPNKVLCCQPTNLPTFLMDVSPKVLANPLKDYCSDRNAAQQHAMNRASDNRKCLQLLLHGLSELSRPYVQRRTCFFPEPNEGLIASKPYHGWSHIIIPNKETLVTDSGKLHVLDSLLTRLKSGGHRVLIYSQMTRMIDLLEEYMWHRKHTYMRLDGSSKISDRRDMVADFQTRSDIFVFLLSTRAGGLGINLTAADTVIFYDSDWNPTVDQQAMDRAHRLGQTKQVTVYRLVCKGTIEERILQRAREKSEIQRMVISGGNFKPDTLKPKEVVSLLLDDDELERKFRLKQEERKQQEKSNGKERKRKLDKLEKKLFGKKKKLDENITIPAASIISSCQDADSILSLDSVPPSPYSEHSLSSLAVAHDDTSSEGPLVVDDGSPSTTPVPPLLSDHHLDGVLTSELTSMGSLLQSLSPGEKKRTGRGRGRPRGSGRRGTGRGRGSVLATAAAELAGARAGKSAAFAAYGYTFQGSRAVSGTTHRGSGVSRPSRGIMRGKNLSMHPEKDFDKQKLPLAVQEAISTEKPTPASSNTIGSNSLGFYVQGTQL